MNHHRMVGYHTTCALGSTDSTKAQLNFWRGPAYTLRPRTRPEPLFIEAAGTARESPGPGLGPGHNTAQGNKRLGGIPAGPSVPMDYRMHMDNKMAMIAASMGHYQARVYD